MATYTWKGSTGSYLDPAQWSPEGVPLYGGDTIATIASGTATLSNAEPNGITLQLTASNTATGILILDNAALGPETTLDASGYSRLEFRGYDTNYGSIVVQVPGGPGYTKLDLFASGFGQLNQYGTITVAAGLEFSGILNNDGLIDIAGGFFNFDGGAIMGTGTIAFTTPGSIMNALGPIGAGQTLALQEGSLRLSNAATFQGTVADFTSSAASITFGDLVFDAASYVDDSTGEHLDLTNAGTVVGRVQLANTLATQYIVTRDTGSATTITPGQVYSDGSIPGVITQGVVTIRNAEPNGQTVYLSGATLVLDNAALGPDLRLVVGAAEGRSGRVILSVVGYDTNYGEIDTPSVAGSSSNLEIKIGAGSQLNQEGTIRIDASKIGTALSSDLLVDGYGTLNNDGQIFIGSGSVASFNSPVTGGGTITVDHATAFLSANLNSQTIDFLGGRLSARPDLSATIKDWNSQGTIDFPGGPTGALLDAVQFNQTSAAGGDLQLLKAGAQVGDLHLLGSYTTADFKIAPSSPGGIGITLIS